jgi:Flp pilus assembly protein TadG
MDQISNHKERGQNLILFSVIMVVMVALAALVIDGGFACTKRRQATNAADAGALAGADALCAGNIDQAIPHALDYAINRNGETDADATLGTKVITVTTTIPHDTFLAGIFGNDVVTTTATASAGCYLPCSGVGVLPVAWACRPPAGEPGTNDCGIQFGTSTDPNPLYVIMDSLKSGVDFYCKDPVTGLPDGALDCDINDDGINEFMTGGDRSWLNLNGGPGNANELRDWVLHGYQVKISKHTWLGGSGGTKDAVFQAVEEIVDDTVILPVFDSYCLGMPNTTCPSIYHPILDKIVIDNGGNLYFHVISFSAFKITSVSAPPSKNPCPGKADAIAANPEIKDNVKTIEGYFITDFFGTGKCDGPDTGVYTIYLNH